MSRDTAWDITFIENYATVTTIIEAPTEEEAIRLGQELLMDNYQMDLSSWQVQAGQV